MKMDQKISQAESNLQRKLEWIGRHDNRVIITTGVVIAMLGVLSSASANIKTWGCFEYLLFGVTLLLLLISLILLYYSQYPKTISPNSSLIFFKTISELDYNTFKTQTKSRTKEEYLDDLLFQTHRNSQILNKKFINLRVSMILLGCSLIPWLIIIYVSQLYFK